MLLALVSCGPSRYVMPIEMRYPSTAGVELAGKVISVTYLENDDAVESLKNKEIAESFASSLEKVYITPNDGINVYRMSADETADYASRDTLINILMDTGADLVFLFDVMKSDVLTLRCFDGMDQEERVRTYTASITPDITDMSDVGLKVASSFEPQWKTEQYSLVYFDNEKWYEPLVKAERFDWQGAMDLWIGLLDSNDPLKRSCAEYNIAVACFMLGDNKLASEWLDRSDAECVLSLSSGFRKRLTRNP